MSDVIRTNRGAKRGAVKSVLQSAWDIVDMACLRVTGQGNLPPNSMRKRVTSLDRFVPTTDEYIAYFKLLGGLRMTDYVLDIGCGTGRFAARLVDNPHFFNGRYEGFDPDPVSIEWAHKNVSRKKPNINFTWIDIANGWYNVEGAVDPVTLTFPYNDDTFDFVFSWSVFTHILPDAADRYLNEIRRVLKPGHKALFTCLLLDGQPEEIRADAVAFQRGVGMKASAARWHHRGPYSILHEHAPELVVAFQRAWISDRIAAAGLGIAGVHDGIWSNCGHHLSEQDVVLVAKPMAAAG